MTARDYLTEAKKHFEKENNESARAAAALAQAMFLQQIYERLKRSKPSVTTIHVENSYQPKEKQ